MICPFGDEALVVVLGETLDPGLNARAHALAQRVRASRDERGSIWGVPVPGHASLLVPFDPFAASVDEATDRLREIVDDLDRRPTEDSPDPGEDPVPATIDVRYGGSDGPDLAAVAERTGLTPEQVVEAHASTVYRVFALGFAPGFAYLGILPPELELPRRADPRARVPRGSVAIAGRQTAVYPSETPGGWHLIGRTDAPLWDIERDPPALLGPGRAVRFVPAER